MKHGTASLKTLALDCTVHERHASSLHGKSRQRRDKPRIKRNLRKKAAMPLDGVPTREKAKNNKNDVFNDECGSFSWRSEQPK